MDINRLDARFGAVVTGLDLSRPLEAVTRSRIDDLFVDSVVLCFRRQSFDRPEAFIRAAENLGRPMAPVTATWRLPGFDGRLLPNHDMLSAEGGGKLNWGAGTSSMKSTMLDPGRRTAHHRQDG